MKNIKKILFIIALIVLVLPLKSNAEDNTVNLYLFYSKTCPHCASLESMLEDIKPNYPNLKVYSYEVSMNQQNSELMIEAASLLKTNVTGVPFTVIGTKVFKGFSESMSKSEIEYTIKLYSKVTSYKDPVGEMLGVVSDSGELTYDDLVEEEKNNSNFIIDVPIVGPVETKDLSLPLISIVMGTIDGFNPCAMWVLLFLISTLIGMKNKKRMWILGSVFMLTSAVVYLLFMLAWLNLTLFIGALWWVKLFIALIALGGGYLNLKAFVKTKEAGCHVVNESKRNKIFDKIKQFTNEKSFPIALIGIITLAVSVNFVELTCSAGLPVIFTNILALNSLSLVEYSLYIFLYILFFLLDDLIIFFIAMSTLKLTGISTKYSKYSHLIGGIIMIIIGLLMIYKPEWLMFNF